MSSDSALREDSRKLTALDRCDRCNSQAYFLTVFEYGELMFCRHHFMKYENDLKDISIEIFDQSSDLS